eukprot:3481154-Alexandrium_andersonii.AAC.1
MAEGEMAGIRHGLGDSQVCRTPKGRGQDPPEQRRHGSRRGPGIDPSTHAGGIAAGARVGTG